MDLNHDDKSLNTANIQREERLRRLNDLVKHSTTEMNPQSLFLIIKEVKHAVDIVAGGKSLSFFIDQIGALPTTIETDESRVKQILISLISSAIKFTEAGWIKLLIECVPNPNGSKDLVFSITDTGFGIPGSTFQFKIACRAPAGTVWKQGLFDRLLHSSGQKPNLKAPFLEGKKVLIVEDSEDNQDIFKYFLASAGAKSDVIGSGEDAVRKAKSVNYDLILMDIKLPNMDGLEATRLIRAAKYKKPIIALTAHASAEEKINCLQAGCDALITKPVTRETLIHQIDLIMEKY